jgi:adenine-specific DNA-methyltransferase
MSNNKQKLELAWIGKNNPEYDIANIEPRILEERPDLSHGDQKTENMIIHGDNLLALKALLPEYEGKVKCIYIDPPYNTGNAFEHYDDCVEHSTWLSLMRPRLELLKMLLAQDGFICCQIDDSEGAYLKVLFDEVFGRNNYLTSFYIQVRYGNKTLAEDNDYQKLIEQCFIYAKDSTLCKVNKDIEEYKVEKFEWQILEKGNGELLELGGKKVELFRPGLYEINKVLPTLQGLKETWATGSLIKQKASSGEFLDKYLAPRKDTDGLQCLYKVYGIGEDGLGYRYFTGPKKATATKGKFYSGIPLQRVEELLKGNSTKEIPIANFYDLAGNFGNCRGEGDVGFRGGKKPEALLEIIFNHFSNEKDLILDSFLGSGTSTAVAHKMGRKYIGIEMGEHAYTHVHKRLVSVVDGTDQTGISKIVDWKGGGGFKFYELAPSFITIDEFGNPVIDSYYNDTKLIRAMCKLTGYTFAPSQNDYWKHGKGQGNNSVYVTTQMLSVVMVQQIASHLGKMETLLICPKKYEPGCEKVDIRITIKKIPQSILKACHYGKKEYLLPIKERAIEEIDEEELIDEQE